LRSQFDAQGREGPGRVAADSSRRAAEGFRDLAVGKTLVVPKDEHGALPPGQLAELGEEGIALGVSDSVVRGEAVINVLRCAAREQPPGAARQDRYSLTTILRTYSSGRSSWLICGQRLCTRISTSWTTSSASPRSPVSTPAKRSTAGSLAAANSSNLITFPSSVFD